MNGLSRRYRIIKGIRSHLQLDGVYVALRRHDLQVFRRRRHEGGVRCHIGGCCFFLSRLRLLFSGCHIVRICGVKRDGHGYPIRNRIAYVVYVDRERRCRVNRHGHLELRHAIHECSLVAFVPDAHPRKRALGIAFDGGHNLAICGNKLGNRP